MNEFQSLINDVIEKAAQSRTEPALLIDGIRHCPTCGRPLEIRRDVFGETRLLPIMCDCEREAEEKRKEIAHLAALADARKKCFGGDASRLASARIAYAELAHPKEAGIIRRYVEKFRELYAIQQGLLIYGPNGTGKSYIAAALCNALIDGGHEAYFTTFSRIEKEAGAKTREGRKEYLDSLNEYSLLVLDDLGAERTSEYMQELVFNVIDSRYGSGKPMIITTNLTMPELKNPQTAQQSRIYDRILQICYPVQLGGESIRRKDTRERFYKAKEMLEGEG